MNVDLSQSRFYYNFLINFGLKNGVFPLQFLLCQNNTFNVELNCHLQKVIKWTLGLLLHNLVEEVFGY